MAAPHVFSKVLGSARGRLAIVVILGLAVLYPAVNCAYLLDDFMHASMIDGTAGMKRGPLDLYDFVNDQDRPLMMERGLLPWWAHSQLTIRFFRPLSSFLRHVELTRLGTDAMLVPHLHSLAWWLFVVVAAWALFERLLAPRPAFLATAIFALGPWHVLPIAWLANREVLLSLAFGIVGIRAQLRLVEQGGARDALLAFACYVVAFAAGEYAFCLGAYVVAAELMRPRAPLTGRALRTLPFVAPALGYLVVRRLGGYGTFASAFYADPFSEPWKILQLAPKRITTLLCEAWLTLGTDAWGTTAPSWLVWTLALGGAAAATVAIRELLAALDEPRQRLARFFLCGALLALAPVVAAVPAPRLLGMSALGMAGLVALLLEHAWFAAAPGPRSTAGDVAGLVATLLGFSLLIHGPAAAHLAARGLMGSTHAYRLAIAGLGAKLHDEGRTEVHVVRGAGGAFFGPFALAARGVLPARWRMLTQTKHALVLRKDERSFEIVTSAADCLYPEGASNLFRDPAHPLRTGEVVEVPGLRVEILQVGPHGPTRALYTFAQPLSAQSYAWIDERARGLEPVIVPRVGFGRPYDP